MPSGLKGQVTDLLRDLGVHPALDGLAVESPIDGTIVGYVPASTAGDVDAAVGRAVDCFAEWRHVPAPRRGVVVAALGQELRNKKEALATLVAIETGKILTEARGEVQEMIDICDFAVGLSRQLYGRTMASERPEHRLTETWHPLGPCAVITAFNFPVAVWAWNAAIALVCGDPVVWKPSEKTPLTAQACTSLLARAVVAAGSAPEGLCQVVHGRADVGQALVGDPRIPLISATGSTAMGRAVAALVAPRFARLILELGGNNAAVVTDRADLDLTARAIVFAAAGTAGQRCTSLRRLIVQRRVAEEVLERIAKAYASLPVGSPLDEGVLVGPLIDREAFVRFEKALVQAESDGGTRVEGGERLLETRYPDAYYVRPAIVTMPSQTEIVRTETFGPLLYVLEYDDLDEAIALHNDVPHGLASSIFTTDLREAERFTGPAGSDCGIVNVNAGPSGAEIGGAFGGEKDTGGGREAGSDAWKSYMRRVTSTVNWSDDLPLAQGVHFT